MGQEHDYRPHPQIEQDCCSSNRVIPLFHAGVWIAVSGKMCMNGSGSTITGCTLRVSRSRATGLHLASVESPISS